MESDKEKKKIRVSASQYSKWIQCPQRWFLDYAKKLRKFEGSLNTCFGTAMHETLQTYIKTLYTDSLEAAETLKLKSIFKETFDREIKKSEKDLKYTEDEYTGFCFDGEDIIDAFLKTSERLKHFPRKKYKFIGIELPLELDIRENLQFVAFLDLVLFDIENQKYKIFDFKTSSSGWNPHMKEDESKTNQLLLYKSFYSKIYNVPLEKIEIEFLILKRKLYENVSFPQSRLQKFTPPHTKRAIVECIDGFTNFINQCFTKDGEYNLQGKFYKNPGKNKKNCKYCIHKKVNCDAKSDIEDDV